MDHPVIMSSCLGWILKIEKEGRMGQESFASRDKKENDDEEITHNAT